MSLMMQLCAEHNHRKSTQTMTKQPENDSVNRDAPYNSHQIEQDQPELTQNDKDNKLGVENENAK